MKSQYKVLTVFVVLFLAGCVAAQGGDDDEAARVMGGVEEPRFTTTAKATITPMPSATIGYQATAQAAETARVAAEGTAVAAARMMVEATAAHEARLQEQIRLTAEAERRAFDAHSWTATARWTSVPLTETQQAAANTQLAGQMTMAAGQMTATAEAPTLVVALANAEAEAEWSGLRQGMEVFALFAVAVFVLVLVWFVIFKAPAMMPSGGGVAEEEEVHELDTTDVKVVDRSEGLSIRMFTVPCSPDALTELAQALVSGQKTLGINLWEGKKSVHFTRDIIKRVRQFLRLNDLVAGSEGERLVLTEKGRKFFLAWLEHRRLPDAFRFGGEA